MQRSNLTLEIFPTIKEVINTMLDAMFDTNGYANFFDATKVVYGSKHEEIIRALINGMESRNEKAMLSEGLCPDCGDTLVNRHINATREGPAEDFAECPTCHDDYVRGIA